MALPKRKISKSRTRKKRNIHYKRRIILAIKTKDKKGYKRPHRDEYIEV